MDRLRRALGARRALDDDTISAALDAVEASVFKEWSTATTPEDREQCFFELSGVRRLRARLASWAADAQTNDEGT